MKTSDLTNLSVKEKLEAMELLWSSLQHEKAAIESPAWHGDVLHVRKERIVKGTAKFIPLGELKTYYRAKN